MTPFKQLNIGDRFKFNHMYFEKADLYQVNLQDGRTVMSNAKFLSDDHYESGKTDMWINGPSVHIADHIEVDPFNGQTRREKVLAKS